MVVYISVLFAFCILFTVVLGMLLYSFFQEDDPDNGGASAYLYLFAYLTLGLIVITAKELFLDMVVEAIWKIGSGALLLNLFIAIGVNFRRVEVHWVIVFFCSILLTIIPFWLDVGYSDNKLNSIIGSIKSNDSTWFIFTVWVPIFIIIVVSILLSYWLSIASKKEQNKFIQYSIERSLVGIKRDDNRLEEPKGDRRERERFKEFENKLMRNLVEEIEYRLQKNFQRYDELFSKHREFVETTQLNSSSNSQLGNAFSEQYYNLANELKEIKSQISTSRFDSVGKKKGFYSNSNNQNFIRELYHYLITPLSQIESKTIVFSTNPQQFLENEDQFRRTILTINVSVEICKTVLAAYRELAFVTASSDWSPESLNKSVIAAANLYKESFEKDVTVNVLLQDNYGSYSNNYILAVILPLLENAIKASPSQKNIKIYEEDDKFNISIIMKNEAINMPTINQLTTDGFSSKKDHRGTGLSIARHLLEDQNIGSLIFDIQNDVIITKVLIPKNASHAE